VGRCSARKGERAALPLCIEQGPTAGAALTKGDHLAMSDSNKNKKQERADAEAKRLFGEAIQRDEQELTLRVKCPRCRGAGVIEVLSENGSGEAGHPKVCPTCAGIGVAAYDWRRSEQPRPLRPGERRQEEADKERKTLAALERRADKFGSR
jgi:hypothetical protein